MTAAHVKLLLQATPAPKFAFFSRSVYYVWWFGLLGLHIVGVTFFMAVARGYWLLPGSYLATCLTFYALGMSDEHHHTLARVHFGVAMCHVAFLLWMVGWSIWRRALVFGSGGWRHGATTQQQQTTVIHRSTSRSGCGSKTDLFQTTRKQRCVAWLTAVFECLQRAYSAVLGRRGFFGVDSANFDFFMVLREVVETSLQTNQAYRMSVFLPRRWLNRFYVSLLVLNCWSTALVHHLYHDSPAHRRILAILFDCLLDMTTSICIPLILVLDYTDDYDSSLHGFQPTMWNNEAWLVNVLNEFQLILVVSWGDMASRLIFSLGMISAMNGIKSLARPVSNQVTSTSMSGPTASKITMVDVVPSGRSTVASEHTESGTPQPAEPTAKPKAPLRIRTYSLFMAPERLGARRTKLTRILSAVFVVWGFVVITLHIVAELNPALPQCRLQVRPWLVSAPACSLVELDCYRAATDGALANVEALWRAFDTRFVVRVVVKHCPRLEMPPTLQQFDNLGGIKLYNTTVARWGEDAAVTNALHPRLTSVNFVRVNFTDGVLPQGLQAADFPRLLADFEFCVTNLKTLPDDLDRKWPKHATVYLELGYAMTEVPAVVARLAPYYLSFAGTPIRELPAALFEAEGIFYLHAGGTGITRLPQDVTRVSSTFSRLVVQNTAVAFFWSWIDPILDHYARIDAYGTSYCKELTAARTALASGATTTGASISSAWMNATCPVSKMNNFSATNLALLAKKVRCVESQIVVYTLEYEDACSSIAT